MSAALDLQARREVVIGAEPPGLITVKNALRREAIEMQGRDLGALPLERPVI